MLLGRGGGVNSVGWRGGKNRDIYIYIFSAGRALHHLYPREFCTLPSFARIKGPRSTSTIARKNRGLWTVYCATGVQSSSVAAVISYVYFIIVTAVIFLGLGAFFCCLFYCTLKGLQAIHVRPYESCYITRPRGRERGKRSSWISSWSI